MGVIGRRPRSTALGDRSAGWWAVLTALAALTLSIATAARAQTSKPHAITETAGEVVIDYSAGVIDVPGSGAADLRAPNAQVARVKAERTARADAGKRLTALLASLPKERLGCGSSGGAGPVAAAIIEQAVAAAATTGIDWDSDGSVHLTLRVPIAALAAPPSSAATPAIVVDGQAHPTLFARAGGGCVAAPRLFDRLADARLAGGDLASAEVLTVPTTKHEKSGARQEPHRVVAVVRSDK